MSAEQIDIFDAMADQQAVVDAVAETPAHVADPEYALFVEACRTDALSHGGFVSQNRVRDLMSNDKGLSINPRRYSGFWRRARKGGLLAFECSEENRDHRGRNLGKESKVFRWAVSP